jgi:hypothetical protein
MASCLDEFDNAYQDQEGLSTVLVHEGSLELLRWKLRGRVAMTRAPASTCTDAAAAQTSVAGWRSTRRESVLTVVGVEGVSVTSDRCGFPALGVPEPECYECGDAERRDDDDHAHCSVRAMKLQVNFSAGHANWGLLSVVDSYIRQF